jgi:hypothetical protein
VGITTFAIVGGGRRAEFFLRLAAHLPAHLRATAVLTRSAARADAVTAAWQIPTVHTTTELLAVERPDFVLVAVPWPASPAVIRDLVAAGTNVLAETPPAPDLDGLRALWHDVGASGRVQVAEQYRLMPTHAARLAVVGSGVIGAPTMVQLSSTHLYHAVSLMKAYLGVSDENATVRATSFTAPLVDPLGPDGWTGDLTPQSRETQFATIDWDGRRGVYEFTENQWFNPLLARRILVRGTHGELADDAVTRMADASSPVSSALVRRETGHDLNLERLDLQHFAFDGAVVYRNPFPGAGLSDDDLAVAHLAVQTGGWARDEGPAPYPLAWGCHDHAIGVAIGASIASGAPVTVPARFR